MERAFVQIRFAPVLTLVLLLAGIAAPAPAQEPAAPPAEAAQTVSPAQLDDLVAPIALYPDPLLGQVLVAATYPLELVEAEQWLEANSDLHGQELMDAAREQNWDPSVQALAAMPDVLEKLTQDIHWTGDLGNVFLAQQADVMSAVQRMRARAEANGKLQSTSQQRVTTEDRNGERAITIEPADPQVIYVPVYSPYYVWGDPVWGYYPSLYYPAYGYGFAPGINIGMYFGGWGGWGVGYGWGWGPNWFGNTIFVNTGFFNRYGYRGLGYGGGHGRLPWTHNPGHRLGVAYSNRQLNSRYGEASRSARLAAGRSGNLHRLGAANVGRSPRGATPQAGVRRQSNQATPRQSQAPARQYQSAPRMSAPSVNRGAGSYRGGSSGSSSGHSSGGGRRR